jgi:hypothetical protein
MRAVLASLLLAACRAALASPEPLAYAPVSAGRPGFGDPFPCAPPVVTASPVDGALFALELNYSRQLPYNKNASASLGTRGTWVYGAFNLSALAAQDTSDAFADVSSLSASLPDRARYDGTCVRAPNMSLGAVTSLYNFAGANQAADFQACMEAGADPDSGAPLGPAATGLASWFLPGLGPDGQPAYDAHGWMHNFACAGGCNELATRGKGAAPQGACSLLYYARRLGNLSDLPLSFFSVELGSLYDCAYEVEGSVPGAQAFQTTWCSNFTDYANDRLVRRVREHRVLANLSVLDEDAQPAYSLLAFSAQPFRRDTPGVVVRNASFLVSLRQPLLLPAQDAFDLVFLNASSGGGATPCENATCARVAAGAPRAGWSTPWSTHLCTAQCTQYLITSNSFAAPALVPETEVGAAFAAADAGGGALFEFLASDLAAAGPSTDGAPVRVAGTCNRTLAQPGDVAACGAQLPAADWDVSVASFWAGSFSSALPPFQGAAGPCSGALPAADLLGRAASASACSGACYAAPLAYATDGQTLNLSLAAGGAAPGSAVVWPCVLLALARAAPLANATPFPSFRTRAAAARFDASSAPLLTGAGLWAPARPTWDDGSALAPACASALAPCAEGYPYREPLAPALGPVIVDFPSLIVYPAPLGASAHAAEIPGGPPPARVGARAAANLAPGATPKPAASSLPAWAGALLLAGTFAGAGATASLVMRCATGAGGAPQAPRAGAPFSKIKL